MSDPLTIGIGVGVVGALLYGLTQQQKTTINVGKLSDRSFQGSEYGGDIPRIYGTVGLSGSQIVWMENNQLKEVVKKKKSGGKGGPSTVTKTYTYFATFALMLCQGEVSGVRRIWCGDKLIYNAGSDDLETIIASNQAAKGWKLYRGTDSQLPDPRYEADVGVGNAPAFRGYTYIAFYDFALADYSNTLQAAQFKVELVSDLSYSDPEVVSFLPASAIGGTIFPGDGSGLLCRSLITDATSGKTAVRDFYAHSSVSGGLKDNGGYTLYPRRFFGSIGFVAGNGTMTQVLVDGSSYPTPMFGSNYATWEGLLIDTDLYVHSIHQTLGTARIARIPLIGTPVTSALTDCYSIASDGTNLYAIGASTLYQLDPETLAVVHSVAISPRPALAPNAGYISCFDGYVYLAPFYNGDIENRNWLQIFDPSTGAVVAEYNNFASPGYAATNGAPAAIWNNLLVQALISGTTGVRVSVLTIPTANTVTLADVITAECELSSLITAADLDVSLLTQQVNGYRVSGGTIRSVIEPLQGAYPFDVVPAGYKIKFVPRGQSSVMTIPWEDLAATDGTDIGDSLPYSREMDSQLPQKVTITALSSTREYASATQSYERLNTSAVNVEQRDIPLVLSDDEIAQMAEKLLFLRWLERDDFDFSLPPTYLALEPADIVTVQAKFGTFELRLTDVNYEQDGRLTCKAKANNAAIYTSNAVGAPGPGPDGTIPLSGQSLLIPLDIPTVDETVQNTAGFVAAMTGYSNGWPGGVMVRSADGGQTWNEVQGFSGKATIGYARGTLPASGGTVISQRTLVVDLISGELESITRDQLIAGQNYAAYGVDGRWEIIRFQTATLQTDGSYLLTGFVRGDRGTEWATGLHQAADLFVLLDDPDNAFVGMAVASIGIASTLRGVTSGAGIDSATDIPFTYRGVNLECLSPVNPHGYRDTSGNFSGTFNRRSRLSSSWWTTGVTAPVGETSLAFEIDVMSGSTVKRTINATSSAWSYSAANQVLDFGSAQSSITFRIYQLSSVVGRGYPLEVTL